MSNRLIKTYSNDNENGGNDDDEIKAMADGVYIEFRRDKDGAEDDDGAVGKDGAESKDGSVDDDEVNGVVKILANGVGRRGHG